MEPVVLDKIPGLKAAVRRAARIEDGVRRRSFFTAAARLAGVPVLPFTPRHYLFLDEARSPFLLGGKKDAGHIAQFLWIVSPDFLMPTHRLSLAEVRAARRAFVRKIAGVRYGRALQAIYGYLDEALFDAPAGGDDDGTRERPIASLGASLIDEFAGRYGYTWPPQVLDDRGQPIHGAGILDMPFALLLQLRRLATVRLDPDAHVGNPLSDKAELQVVNRYLAKPRKGTR